jgi:hypothetical protein
VPEAPTETSVFAPRSNAIRRAGLVIKKGEVANGAAEGIKNHGQTDGPVAEAEADKVIRKTLFDRDRAVERRTKNEVQRNFTTLHKLAVAEIAQRMALAASVADLPCDQELFRARRWRSDPTSLQSCELSQPAE